MWFILVRTSFLLLASDFCLLFQCSRHSGVYTCCQQFLGNKILQMSFLWFLPSCTKNWPQRIFQFSSQLFRRLSGIFLTGFRAYSWLYFKQKAKHVGDYGKCRCMAFYVADVLIGGRKKVLVQTDIAYQLSTPLCFTSFYFIFLFLVGMEFYKLFELQKTICDFLVD